MVPSPLFLVNKKKANVYPLCELIVFTTVNGKFCFNYKEVFTKLGYYREAVCTLGDGMLIIEPAIKKWWEIR